MRTARTVLASLIVLVMTAGFFVIADGQEKQADKKTTTAQSTQMTAYSCPMHPDVKADKAGTCSKCGMELKKQVGEAKKAGKDAKAGTMKKMKKEGCGEGGCCDEK